MKKQIIIIGIIVLLVTVGLSGCNEANDLNNLTEEEQKFVGTWVYEINPDYKMIFNADKTGKRGQWDGVWELGQIMEGYGEICLIFTIIQKSEGGTGTGKFYYDHYFEENNTVLYLAEGAQFPGSEYERLTKQ